MDLGCKRESVVLSRTIHFMRTSLFQFELVFSERSFVGFGDFRASLPEVVPIPYRVIVSFDGSGRRDPHVERYEYLEHYKSALWRNAREHTPTLTPMFSLRPVSARREGRNIPSDIIYCSTGARIHLSACHCLWSPLRLDLRLPWDP